MNFLADKRKKNAGMAGEIFEWCGRQGAHSKKGGKLEEEKKVQIKTLLLDQQ